MSDTRKASLSIPISAKQTVRPSGETVTHSTWSPQESQSRQDAIEEARRVALEQHQKTTEDSTSVGQRLVHLENLVVQLQNDLAKVYQLLGASTTSSFVSTTEDVNQG